MEYSQIATIVKDIHSKMDIDCSNPSPIKVISKIDPTNNLKFQIKRYSHARIDISIKSLDFFSLELYGIYEKFKVTLDTFRVKILLNNRKGNTCWERYVVTKELSHILTGNEKITWTKDIIELISELSDGVSILQSSNKDVLETEYVTLIIAMELLVPFQCNSILLDTTKTSKEIASVFMIPEKVIDIMKKPDYQKLRTSAYN